MAVGIPRPAIGKRFCLDDRYNINKLGTLIGQPSAEELYTKEAIEEELKKSANLHGVDEHEKPLDKLSAQHKKEGFQSEESISSREAYLYIRGMAMGGKLTENSLQGHVSRALHRLYYADSLFAKVQTPIPVKISDVYDAVHDVDTIKMEDAEPDHCNAGPSTISVRINGIDGLEVADYYDERYAVVSREDYALELKARGETYDYPYGEEKEEYLQKDRAAMEKNKGFINGKLVGDVDKVHLALSQGGKVEGIGSWNPRRMNYWDRAILNNTIAAAMIHAGRMATMIGEDLLKFKESASASSDLFLYGSQAFWEIDGAPPIMCGSLQPYDDHGRRVGRLAQSSGESRSVHFMTTRLPKLMKEKEEELKALFEKRVKFVRKQLAEGKVKNENVNRMVEYILAKIPSPTELYKASNAEAMAAAFRISVQAYPSLANDYQALQLILGTASYYKKFPGEMRVPYEALSRVATTRNFGLNGNDFVFMALRNVNEVRESHNPELCKME